MAKKTDLSRHKNWMRKNNKVNIILVVDKEKREQIKIAAEEAGLSMNHYALDAIDQKMAIDAMPGNMSVMINRNEAAKNGD